MKIQYVFRHLGQSDFLTSFAQDHVEKVLHRHQQDPNINAVVKLEMENSPQHPGPDIYRCEIRVKSPRHGNLIISKTKSNMYEAISAAADRLALLFDKVKGKVKARRRKGERPGSAEPSIEQADADEFLMIANDY